MWHLSAWTTWLTSCMISGASESSGSSCLNDENAIFSTFPARRPVRQVVSFGVRIPVIRIRWVLTALFAMEYIVRAWYETWLLWSGRFGGYAWPLFRSFWDGVLGSVSSATVFAQVCRSSPVVHHFFNMTLPVGGGELATLLSSAMRWVRSSTNDSYSNVRCIALPILESACLSLCVSMTAFKPRVFSSEWKASLFVKTQAASLSLIAASTSSHRTKKRWSAWWSMIS